MRRQMTSLNNKNFLNHGKEHMKILLSIFLLCSMTVLSFGQSASAWKTGTITEVKAHETGRKVSDSDVASYDVSLKVGDTIYVVLYTPPLGQWTVKYAGGRSGLVLVGKTTIRYNDLLGQSFDLPIESQKTAPKSKESETISVGLNN